MRGIARVAAGAVFCALVVTGPRPAAADILVNISKASQRMAVLVDGTARYNWKVSTGAKRYTTPSGVYKPQWLARKWRSKQYNNAPMPHSIFFHNGYAIHGTTEVARLGKEASHGCVRLHPDNAATLYSLVGKHMASTRVVVSDDLIEAPGEAPKRKPLQVVAEMAVAQMEQPSARVIVLDAPTRAPSAPRGAPQKQPDPAMTEDADGSAQPAAPVPAKPAVQAPAAPATAKPVLEVPRPAPAPAKVKAVSAEPVAEQRPREPSETRAIAKPKVVTYSRDTRPGFYW